MKKLILVSLMLVMAGSAFAQWDYAWPNNTLSKTFDSLVMVTTVTDTTVKYYFKHNSPTIQVFIDSRAKAATATAYNHPRIEYKWIGGDGNPYGSDSANGWIKLCDSSHVTITAAAHTYQVKPLTNATGMRGIYFKGVIAPVESTITKIRVQE